MTISIIGIYPITEAEEPCYLVEAIIRDYIGTLDFGEITQAIEGVPRKNWQVPWDEYLLDDLGTSGRSAPFPAPTQIDGDQRIAFLIYYLDPTQPLITPFGEVNLPDLSPRPEGLDFIKYRPPC